ncbi:MAG: hypothetical protein COB49_08705 [Alphaproteobacteria bacterium]|nr:MAG: hypothetical protein COB49_08705 [Alphaproteobacteria bacterium]
MPDNKACLVIFCKRPTLFQGKQRLAKTIGAPQTYIFAKAFLMCALEDARSWPGPVVLSPASAEDRAWAGGLLERDHHILAQPEGCLGHRLQAIDQQLRNLGHDKIIFIGTDAPILAPHHYQEARKALEEYDVVLSPASDGGVTIMGSRKGWPQMTGLPWSTEHLGATLENLCCDHGHRVKKISPSYDIDVEEDLLKLWRDMRDEQRPARQELCRKLGEFLALDRVKYG